MAGYPSRLEPGNLCDGLRPDDKTHVSWANGQAIIWGVTCVDTVADSYVAGCSETTGYAAKRAEEFKAEKYLRMTETYHFIPIGIETFGAIGPATDKFFGTLGKLIKQKTGEPRSLEFLKQRISLDIQRGNSAPVLGTLPQSWMLR